ncbi:hypothetical protein GQ457_17G019440 [Hibiscus cannabinus]
MSMFEIHDMIKELGYATPYNLYWQKPGGILKVSPLRIDSDMLTMLGALPRQKYIHVYIEENVGHLVDTNEDEIAWIDEHETVWFDADDNVDNTIRNAETVRSVEIVRNAETVRIDETVRNVENVRIDETVRTYEIVGIEAEFDDENSSEDDDYVVSDHKDSDSPLEDSENDLADSGDEVCDVHVGVGVGVGRDIPGFSAAVGENEEMDNESDIDGSDLLHSASHFQGYLLAAVGIDTNDCIYPLAYAVVESENTSSWCWFLQILEEDLELTNSHHYTFMSDKQKGLMEGISELFPNAEHRTCVRHLYSNFKNRSRFQGKTLKDALWKAARATYMKCWPRNAGGNRYEVPAGHEDQHVVDLGAESCICRKWDLTGIPCVHAIAVIIMRGERPEGFVNNCYKTETQLQIYSNLVKSLRGPKQWPRHVTNEPILPPVIRRPVGRPQKNRRKEADEILTSTGRMSKKGVVRMTCSKCGNSGHNKRSCKGVVGGNRHLASNSSARKPQRKIRRVANSIVPQQVSTQEKHVSTAYIPPIDRISKLSVKRVAPDLQATSSSQHCPNTSQGSVTNTSSVAVIFAFSETEQMGVCFSTSTTPTTNTGTRTGTGGRGKSAPRNREFGKVKGGGNARGTSTGTGTRTGGSGKSAAPIVPKFVKIEGGGNGNGRGQADAIKFSLVSYNILAKAYFTSNHFPHSSSPPCFRPCCFSWEARSQQILSLLKNLAADFYSLQELDEYDFFCKKRMESLGYSSIYIKRSGQKPDGCGIFYKKNRAQLLLKEEMEYDLVPLEHDEASSSSDKRNDPPTKRIKTDRVGIMAAFKLEGPRRHVVILANTHLHGGPKTLDVRLAQAKYLLRRLAQFKTLVTHKFHSTPSVMLCGDFNSTPRDKVYRYLNSGNTSSTSSDRCLGELPLPLYSTYASAGGEPPFTAWNPKFTSTLDYVFFSPSDCLKPVSILRVDSADVAGGLPNYSHPSDHLPIARPSPGFFLPQLRPEAASPLFKSAILRSEPMNITMDTCLSTRTGGSGKSAPIIREFVKVEVGGNARGQADAIRFRVVSYNILAQVYVKSQWFPHSPYPCLGWNARSQAILTLLKNLGADFYFLQEVDEYDSFYKISMENLGYSSIYIQRSGQKLDGCGIFYKNSCAQLLLKETIEYNDLVTSVHGEASLSLDKQDLSGKFSELSVKSGPQPHGDPNDPRVRLKKDCVGIMAAFKLKHPFHHVVVLANTHLYWDPKLADVKLAQANYLLARLAQFKTLVAARFECTPTVILCGDFNSTPADKVYQYLISGNTSSTSSDRCLGELPLPLCSTYASAGGEPRFTTCTPNFTSTLDYIFFSPSDCLKPVSILQLAELDSPDVAGGLPNYSHPSDHLPIGAEFEITKTKH